MDSLILAVLCLVVNHHGTGIHARSHMKNAYREEAFPCSPDILLNI
jgi:hypothetical protein